MSNNLKGKMPIPKEAIIRVNLAWMNTYQEAVKIIKKSKRPIYLDYPSGRTKPPKPIINLDEAIELTKLDNVKFFAVSNIETAQQCQKIKNRVDVVFVPKIETEKGILNLKEIEKEVEIIMLDKEDLYTDVKQNSNRYNELLKIARQSKLKILELQGVVFYG